MTTSMYDIYTKFLRASQIINIFGGLEIIFSEITYLKDRIKNIFMYAIDDKTQSMYLYLRALRLRIQTSILNTIKGIDPIQTVNLNNKSIVDRVAFDTISKEVKVAQNTV